MGGRRGLRVVPPDPRYVGVRVDNNFFDDSLDDVERSAADAIMQLAIDMKLLIAIPHTVRKELDNPRTPRSARERANQLVYTLDTGMGDPAALAKVASIMRGNALPGKHAADAAHLYDTAIWQAGYFVTCDRRVLQKATQLVAVIGQLWIVKPSELMVIYNQYVRADPAGEI